MMNAANLSACIRFSGWTNKRTQACALVAPQALAR